MELQPIHGKILVLYSHNLPLRRDRRDAQCFRYGLRFRRQGMVSCRVHLPSHSRKQFAVCGKCDPALLSVHQLFRRSDHRSVGLTDGLMPQTDTQDRDLPLKCFHRLFADTRILRIPRPRRQYNMRRIHLRDFLHRDLVISYHTDIRLQCPQVLNQIVRKAVIIVDEQYHPFPPPSIYHPLLNQPHFRKPDFPIFPLLRRI